MAARIDFRLSTDEKATLQGAADAAGVSVSQFVRQRTLGQGLEGPPDTELRLEDLEKRLSRLEEMAGL